MRDAANGPKLIENIFKDTGIQIEIIAGEEEAGIVYNNHVEQLEDRDGNYIYVDVGGGSTEINLLTNGELVCSRSYNVGTIRILNGGVDEAAWQRMRDELAELAAPYGDVHIIGSGGNINKLYRLTGKKDKEAHPHHRGAARPLRRPKPPHARRAHGGVQTESRPRRRHRAGR